MINILTDHAEDLTRFGDEILDEEDSSYEGDWVVDFVDKYGVDITMAKLLNLPVKTLEDINLVKDHLSIPGLKNILEEYGPIAIRLTRGNNLPGRNLSPSEKITTASGLERNIYNIDKFADNIPHCVLLIGCNDQPTQQVYFLDPNYPDMILSMGFELFKKNFLMTEFVHFSQNKLVPDEVIFTTPRHKRGNNNEVNSSRKRHKANQTHDNSLPGADDNAMDYETNDHHFYYLSIAASQLFFTQRQTVFLGEQELGQRKLPTEQERENNFIDSLFNS
ncbi:hypothetical protein [Legionella sp. PC1000]|nr:hypothetical protein [Legionella sp. PC1000]